MITLTVKVVNIVFMKTGPKTSIHYRRIGITCLNKPNLTLGSIVLLESLR